jgi:hypothetical protein
MLPKHGFGGEESLLSSVSIDAFYAQYPRLLDDPAHKITSEATDRYNCVAWVQRDTKHWIDPELFWPADVPEPQGDDDLACYMALFRSWGFEDADDPDLEEGYLKIAIFGTGEAFDHVAKQLPSGRWSSKGGTLFDFRHGSPEAVEVCRVMPGTRLVAIMRRPYDGIDSHEVEEHGLVGPSVESK